MRRFIVTVLLLSTTHCTFNVDPFRRDIQRETTASFSRLEANFESSGGALESATVRLRAASGLTSNARISVEGLRGSGQSPEALANAVRAEWSVTNASTMGLFLGYNRSGSESVWINSIDLSIPVGTDVHFRLGSTSIDMAEIGSREATIVAGSGSIRVRDVQRVALEAGSGSIDVVASEGTLRTGSGSIAMQLMGPVQARAGSGSIAGRFGGHATIETGSGSSNLELLGALTGDTTLTAGSGSIVLVIPRGASMQLDLDAGSGSITVRAGETSFRGDRWVGALGAGGFTVRARAGSGSVTVVEASDS